MPKIPIEAIERIKATVDLREIARQYTTLHGQGHEVYGPCPRCGGTDRLHIQPDRFFCRQCLPPETGQGRHDAIDFLIWVGQARNFREALDLLSGALNYPLPPVRHTRPPVEPGLSYESPAYQERAWQEVNRCHQLLLSEQGGLGQAYLQKRGLTRSSWQPALLGLTPRLDSEGNKGWAIAIPWWYRGRVTAVNYRFIAPQGAQRYTRYGFNQYYGDAILYSLPPKGGHTLVVVEGEINALSVHQATPWDAVSIGSQNMTKKTLEALRNSAASYQHIKLYTDEPQVAASLRDALGGRGDVVVADGDANELLIQGRLQQVIA
jgi:DNA primase